MSKYAAFLFTLISTGVGVFQVALVLGAPWGEFTLGGRWRGSLPGVVRLLPLLSLLERVMHFLLPPKAARPWAA